MHTLIFFAIATFTGMHTGDTAQGVAQVHSVTECARVVNAYRTQPIEGNGDTYYMTDAKCVVVER